VALVECGAVTMTGKGFDDGLLVASEVVSTPSMLRWVDRNPLVRMAPPRYSHGAGVLGRIPRFVAVNSAVEVALDGAANSETAGGTILSGPGGAPDYAFGAAVSTGGRFLCALRSTAARGSVSRIVPAIGPPDRVTLPAYLADRVITEHGCASLRGLTLPERADALTALAAPQHREALARSA
jgi:acetyl-CoA hydrolase